MTTAATPAARPGLRAMIALAATVAVFIALALVAPEGAYPWVKALHVISVIAWMAGMLYLPRLFVNHAGKPAGSPESELLKGMEERLLRIIANPAMVLTWVTGAWIAWTVFGLQGGWLHGKIALVVILSGVHGWFSASVRRFREDRNRISERHWRMINEIPALLMIGIVILVIVKPF